MSSRGALLSGAFLCAVGVGLGAFGTHGLKELITAERLVTWETAVRYQLIHGLGLLLVGLIARHYPGKIIRRSALLLFSGASLFSGSLFILVATDISWLGLVAPLGGIGLITGWIGVLLAVVFSNKSEQSPV